MLLLKITTVEEKKLKYTPVWKDEYHGLLNDEERLEAQKIIISNDFSNIAKKTTNIKIQHFLRHYTIPTGTIDKTDPEYTELKKHFDHLIKKNQQHNLTITYDFEALQVRKKRIA